MKKQLYKILIVDDEEMIRDIISQFAEKIFSQKQLNAKIFLASNLEQAKDMLKQDIFDLIITDLSLSGFGTNDGLDVIRYARSKNDSIRWILATGLMLEGTEQQADDLGVSKVLLKPFTLSTLECAVADIH